MISYENALIILSETGCEPDVIAHCMAVSSFSVKFARKLAASGKMVDVSLVEIGGILHDLGRARTHGIEHAAVGAKIAEELGLDPQIVRIIKCHIGAGISREDAISLGLPDDDYIPRSMEEKIVAHADNLMHGTRPISLEEYISRMRDRRLGEENIERIKALADELGVY
ncbi:MAG: TIGR00295 family protein [Methanosarcinaceae archaeon]|nr:TIGR00295 family protein [Methanosarcinaceae archaeon]